MAKRPKKEDSRKLWRDCRHPEAARCFFFKKPEKKCVRQANGCEWKTAFPNGKVLQK